ncbi:CHAT domain-containing protein [Fulvivirga sp.]|uniref:CHAT domain-containing protein n=1 Tax=Fulvivirga sp. TaxID=1931237 RepID=UPI0032EF64DA
MNKAFALLLILIPCLGYGQTSETTLNKGTSYYQSGNYDSAEYYYLRVLKNEKPNSLIYLLSELQLAELYCKVGKGKEAIQLSKTLEKKMPNDTLQARVYINLGNAMAIFNGDNDSSLYFVNKSINILKEKENNKRLLANAYKARGVTYFDLSEYQNAINDYNKALVLFEATSGRVSKDVANTLNNIANALDGLGYFEDALKYHQESLTLKKQVYTPDHLELAKSYNNLGNSYQYLGQFDKSLEYFEKAKNDKIKTYGYLHGSVASTLNNIGNVYFDMGQYSKSLEVHHKALSIRQSVYPKNHSILLYSYLNMARVFPELGQNDSAIYYSHLTLDILNKNYDQPNYFFVVTYLNYSSYLANDNLYDEALEYLGKALSIAKGQFGIKHPVIAEIYSAISDIYEKQQYINKAITCINEAIVTLSHHDANDIGHVDVEDVLDQRLFMKLLIKKCRLIFSRVKLVQEYRETPDVYTILNILGQYDKFMETYRKSLFSKRDIASLAEDSRDAYDMMVEANYILYKTTGDDKYALNALGASEKGKSNVLLSRWAESNGLENGGVPSEILRSETDLRKKISFYQTRIKDKNDDKHLFDSLFTAKRNLEKFIKDIETSYPKYYDLKYNYSFDTLTIELGKRLDSNEMLVEFYKTDSSLFKFTVTNEGFGIKKVDLDVDFKSKVASFIEMNNLQQSVTPSRYNEAAKELYDVLLEDCLEGVHRAQLIIVPDDILEYIPFELLNSRNSKANYFGDLPYLIHNYSVRYANSISLLFRQERKKIAYDRPLVSYAPGYALLSNNNSLKFRGASIGPLVWNQKEASEIASLFDGTSYLDQNATEKNFKQSINKPRIMHFAMHALIDDKEPMNSKLVFESDSSDTEDGYLHAFELYNMKLEADLAVLSACNTGTGFLTKGEGVMNLARAFSYAGVLSVVMTYWSIDDNSSKDLMIDFYQNLSEGKGKSEALRHAKLEFLESASPEKQHPFYWGAFVVIGNDEPLFRKYNKNCILILCLLFFSLTLFITHRNKI